MSARVTMRDVALAVGVSPMTVSRAFKEDTTVNAGTRMRIRQAARDLGYVYDVTAQAFRTQKSGFVGVTLPSINNANFASTFRGLTNGLEPDGLQILLGSTNYSAEKEEALVRQLLARNPEAMVVTGGHHTDATRAMLNRSGLPVIEIWDLPDAPLGHVVGFSNADAMALLVDHLVAKGCQKLGFLGASDLGDARGRARRGGVIEAAKRRGLPKVTVFDAGPPPVSMRHGAEMVAVFKGELDKLDALLCVSDPVAFGALCACRRFGRETPDELAITGFGNFEVGAVSEPRITSVDVQAEEMGAEVAALLNDSALLEGAPVIKSVEVQLVLGQTS